MKGCPSGPVLCAVGSSGVWGKWGSLCPRFHGRLVDLGRAGKKVHCCLSFHFFKRVQKFRTFGQIFQLKKR